MKKILAIELYELLFTKEYLLVVLDRFNRESFTKIIQKTKREELLTTITEQLQIFLKER